ncbi:MAG TPA: VWA domain-containing protein, partial [Rubrivivax sp.]|nr:VWA domain-containing protein [Rubrivivax sp.]
YSRMLLHFTHALGHAEARVESFVFGTRLTRTTRSLRQRDPDIAVAQVARAVQDWAGGTRISECLRQFNRQWARRVLPGRATVLLITDGLEHGHTEALGFEMERLHKSCRRLIWLNPLLRFDAFEPRAGGIKAMLPHVDRFLPAHNLQSLEQLAQVLAGGDAPGRIH